MSENKTNSKASLNERKTSAGKKKVATKKVATKTNTKSSKKTKNVPFVFSKTRLILFLIVAALLVLTLPFDKKLETIMNVGVNNTGAELDEAGLQVHFVNVGQGDGIVIELPDGKTMIIDAGPSKNASKLLSYIDNNVFENKEEKMFDYMIITHSDTDHIGAVDEVLDAYQVNNIYRPEIYSSNIDDVTSEPVEVVPNGKMSVATDTYAKVIKKVLTEPNANIVFNFEGLIITGGSGLDAYIFTFYSPTENYYSDVNSYSPIIVLQYREKAILLTGDASVENEMDVLSKNSLPKIDVIKLGHHGSNTSTSEELLLEIDVTYAIVSAGEDNSYGHPHQETINRLTYAGVSENEIYNTAVNGNIVANITTNGKIFIFTQVESSFVFVEWEYVVISLILLTFYFTFTIKIKELV